MSDPRSMGNEFMQRRAAAAAAGKSSSSNATGGGSALTSLGSASDRKSAPAGGGGGGGGGAPKKSFADIQREQEQEQRQRQGASYPRGGGRGAPQGGMGTPPPPPPSRQQRNPPTHVLQRPPPAAGDDHGGRRARPSDHPHRGPGRRGDNPRRSHPPASNNPRASLPLEQGSIHTLLDKFGFIMCADRDAELFFHYSELTSGRSDALHIGDEVEFRVGTSEDRGGGRRSSREGEGAKLCALDVRALEPGTIEWETEDVPGKRWRGIVDRPPTTGGRDGRSGSGRGSAGPNHQAGGTIRLLADCDDDGDGDAKEEEEGGDDAPTLEIHYRPADYTNKHPGHSRLERKDVVEFDLVTERRTGNKFARNISLVRSERERRRRAREAELLEGAPLERGRVVSERGECGYLRSASRVEEVYFHVSHLVDGPEKKEEAEEGEKKDEKQKRGMPADVRTTSILKEGQEVEFYVVDEGSTAGGGGGGGGRGGTRGGGGNKGLSARKIRLLPPGSVQFERPLASGIVGTVVSCPVASTPAGFGRRDSGRDRRGGAKGAAAKDDVVGKVCLAEPLTDASGAIVAEVALSPDQYPGGTFAASRTGGEMSCWIRPGDLLLFDAVQKVVDGSCHAVPTQALVPHTVEGGGAASDSSADATKVKPAVRLVDLSLCGRAEGTIKSVQDNFGFVQLAERNVDVYVPLFEVLPNDLQTDLSRNDPSIDIDGGAEGATKGGGGRVHVEVGMEVSFDLCLQPPPNDNRGGGGGRYGRQGSKPLDKESYRARRVRLLPKGIVLQQIPIAAGVQATVAKVEPRQPFAGTLELEEPTTLEHVHRHPLVARLLDDVANGRYGAEGATYPEALGDADARTVTGMVNARDDLGWRWVPEGAEDNVHARRLCIFKREGEEANEEAAIEEGEDPESSDGEAPKTINGTSAAADGEGDGANGEGADAAGDAGTTIIKKPDAPKTKGKKAASKVLHTVRFDKSSFPDLTDGPLGVGDVITCDVVQIRRSGAILAQNISVVERKAPPAIVSDGEEGKETNRVGATGIVTEIVAARQFGFITALDEEGNRGDHVFFHFNELVVAAGGGDAAPEAPPSSLSAAAGGRGKRSSSRGDTIVINKGDEVKFDVGIGKNGKLCATHVSILPRGTLKLPAAAADANAPTCTGYILLEPSHTSLANTPSHSVAASGGPSAAASSAGGRWANVRDDKPSPASRSGSNVKEEGVILLLTDPSHLFAPKPTKKKKAEKGTPVKETDAGDVSATEASARSADEREVAEAKDDDDRPPPAFVGMHLRYRPNALAARNTGSSGRAPEPRRGDLITFGKTRGAKIVKEIRIEKAGAATSVRGVLTDLASDEDTAVFVSCENEADRYEIRLTEVVSCDKALLKDGEQVDGILHEGKIFGVCRTKDLFLASSMSKYSSGGSSAGGGPKERPRLNLTVKKELQGMGGQIMAQSRMAKGPDGTTGFVDGWTTRVSPHAVEEDEEEDAGVGGAEEGEGEADESALAPSLSAAASEFVPNFTTATSGFESAED